MSEPNGKLPHGWIRTKLGDVLEFKYGKSLPAKRREGSHYPVFGSNGIIGQHSEALVGGPALIIGRKGSIGEVHQSDGPCSPIDTTYFVDDFCNQPIRFWYYRLKSLRLAELNRATALPGLNRQDAYDLEITLPPLAEQRRIAVKIEALQARSQGVRKALAEVGSLIEQFRQSVLATAFRGDLTAGWRASHPNGEPACELLHRIRTERRRHWEQAELAKYEAKGQKPPKDWQDKYEEPEMGHDSDLPELPAGWLWCQLGLLGEDPLNTVQTGPFGAQLHRTEFTTEGVPVIAVGNLTGIGFTRKGLYFVTEGKAKQLRRYDVQAGDLLFARSGATLGKVCVAPSYVNDWRMTGHILRARLNRAFVVPEIVAFALWGDPVVKSNVTRRIRGMTRPGYNTSLLQSIPIPLPPLDEQRVLLALISQAFSGVDYITDFSQVWLPTTLDSLDQAILAKAFCGELVLQDSNDEPASALLARIREQRAQQAEAAKSTEKTTNMQRRNAMRKKPSGLTSQHQPLVEVLTTKGKPMPPEQLLTEAGYDDDTIEDFYLVLREEIASGRIRENRLTESDVMLEAVKQ
jgi:type I restriction enzyme, S subunit